MPRNLERDAQRMEDRKKKLIKAGIELFSEKGIESVSLQDVATKAGVPIATLYKYYQNKINLVVAISTELWSDVWNVYTNEHSSEMMAQRNAYESIETYCDTIIAIYRKKPSILCFSSNYKTYITRECVTADVFDSQLDALKPVSDKFHEKYEAAKTDHSIRTDISEKELFSMIMLTMLGMAERYAQGVVWAKLDGEDYTQELLYLKDMLLMWAKG